MTPQNEYRFSRLGNNWNHEENPAIIAAVIVLVVLSASLYFLVARFHFRPSQLVEFFLYAVCAFVGAISIVWYAVTLRNRRENNWPHPPLFISQSKDRAAVKSAFAQNAIVLGYDVHSRPWLWPDATRIMQAAVCGATGSGKTTLLRNIITQDLFRVWGSREAPRRMPMLIFDGKADKQYLSDLLPAIEAAGRMHQLRVLDPSRPDISVRYNAFFSDAGLYEEHSGLVFE